MNGLGILGCLASFAQSGAVTYQIATNPGVANTAIAAEGGAFQGVPVSTLVIGGLVIVGLYLVFRKK